MYKLELQIQNRNFGQTTGTHGKIYPKFYQPNSSILLIQINVHKLRVEEVVTTCAFPKERLVIGVMVTCTQRWWVKVQLGHDSVWTRSESFVTQYGWHLHRHAWVTLVALVVTTWRPWTHSGFLFKWQTLPNTAVSELKN